MPMSRKRCSAAVASVACSDESTKWPVSADCTAMRAVSTSRISPTRITSGSWRRIDLQAVGERDAGLLVDLDLVDRREDVLDRVFDRHDVALGLVDLGQRRVERGGLAAPGRAGADHHAVRRPDQPREDRRGSRPACRARRAGAASGSCRAAAARPSRPRSSPWSTTRTSSVAAVDRHLELAVLRTAPLDDVHVGHDLDAADERLAPSMPGSVDDSCSAPSMRKRTRTVSSCGSMCTSEARSRTACVTMR